MTRRAAGPTLHGKRTYSQLCGRWFASRMEARRGEELALLERAGEIEQLRYQVPFVLCNEPKIRVTIDFAYWLKGHQVQKYEDTKGVLTREFRVKLAWLREKYGITVDLT